MVIKGLLEFFATSQVFVETTKCSKVEVFLVSISEPSSSLYESVTDHCWGDKKVQVKFHLEVFFSSPSSRVARLSLAAAWLVVEVVVCRRSSRRRRRRWCDVVVGGRLVVHGLGMVAIKLSI